MGERVCFVSKGGLCNGALALSCLPSSNAPLSPHLHLFNTQTGNSVCVFVHGFEPYFYCECPQGWVPEDYEELLGALRVRTRSARLCMRIAGADAVAGGGGEGGNHQELAAAHVLPCIFAAVVVQTCGVAARSPPCPA